MFLMVLKICGAAVVIALTIAIIKAILGIGESDKKDDGWSFF